MKMFDIKCFKVRLMTSHASPLRSPNPDAMTMMAMATNLIAQRMSEPPPPHPIAGNMRKNG